MSRSGTRPLCGRVFDGSQCRKRDDHHCHPRADHVVAFFNELFCTPRAAGRARRSAWPVGRSALSSNPHGVLYGELLTALSGSS